MAQVGATVASQAVSSLTNFAAAALALRAGSLADFGRFAIAFQVAQLVVIVAQGGLGDAVLSLGSVPDDETRGHRFRDGSARVGVAAGSAVGALVAGGGLVAGGALGRLLILVGVGCPSLVAQYVLRATLFSERRPGAALAADLVWFAVIALTAVGDLLGMWAVSPTGYLAAWLAGSALSAAPLLWRAIAGPSGTAKAFWSRAGPQALRLAAEALLGRGVYVVSLLEVSWFLGDAAAGSFAAAVLVLSPMSVVHTSLSALYLPRLAGRLGVHVPSLRTTALIAVLPIAATLAWAATLAAAQHVPTDLGPFDLAANGVGAALFGATIARFCALAAWRGPLVALRVADASGQSLRARIVGAVAQVLLPVAGLLAGRLALGATGLAVGTWIGAAAAWWAWWRLRSRPPLWDGS